MTREQAINYLFSSGFTNEQVSDVVRALTYEPTIKNDLGVDCISRKAALDITWHDPSYSDPLNVLTEVRDKIRELPSVTPQEPCDKCEVGNPCLYCKHEFEAQERGDKGNDE